MEFKTNGDLTSDEFAEYAATLVEDVAGFVDHTLHRRDKSLMPLSLNVQGQCGTSSTLYAIIRENITANQRAALPVSRQNSFIQLAVGLDRGRDELYWVVTPIKNGVDAHYNRNDPATVIWRDYTRKVTVPRGIAEDMLVPVYEKVIHCSTLLQLGRP